MFAPAAPVHLDLLIATFKRQRLLARTLDSVAKADRPPGLTLRVIVVDNDATAPLHELERGVAGMPMPVMVLQEPRPGKSNALNRALAASTAEYVGFVDDDEEVTPTWFEVVETAFSGSSDLDYIGGRSLLSLPEGLPGWIPHGYDAVLGGVDSGPVSCLYGPQFTGILTGGNAVVRRELLIKLGGFQGHLGPRRDYRLLSGEDEELYYRLVEAEAKGGYLPELVVRHYLHPERLQKRYYRAWTFWNGVSRAQILRSRPDPVPHIFGVPRYLYGRAVLGLAGRIAASFRPASARQRLTSELPLWHLAGYLRGRYWPLVSPASSPDEAVPTRQAMREL